MWGCMSVVPALGTLRQEDHEFKSSLGCIARSLLFLSWQRKWLREHGRHREDWREDKEAREAAVLTLDASHGP